MSIRFSACRALLFGAFAMVALSACGGASEQDGADGGSLGDAVRTDSGTFVLGQSSYTVNEGAGALTLVIRRTGGTQGTVQVSYETVEYDDGVNNPATAMNSGSGTGDFQAMAGTLVFAAGETRKSVSVPVIDDAEQEADLHFGFRLTDVSRGKLGTPVNARVTIADNDMGGQEPSAGSFRLSSTSYTVNEAGGALEVTVRRENGSDGAASVDYATFDNGGGAVAGSDYAAVTGTLSFADGETQRSFSVGIVDDDAHNGDLSFGLRLSAASSDLTSPSEATVTISEDDPEPGPTGAFRFAASDHLVAENSGSVSFTVERVNGSSGAASVDYATGVTGTGDGHAVPGEDFSSASGTLEFADGQTRQSFSVPLIDDDSYTGSLTFSVRLTNADTTLSSPSEANVTISDNEQEPVASGDLRFSASGYSVDETAGSVTVTVERVNGTTGEVAVDYATQALNTGGGDAVAGSDFQSTSGTLVFAEGVTERSFQVTIIDDASYTGDLSFGVSLGNADTATVSPSSATVSILDDEPEPQDAPTLVWDAPTTNADGSCLEDLDGFRVNYGLSSGNQTEAISLGLDELTATATGETTACGDVTAYEFPLDVLDSASWYITVQSRDTAGNLSADSEEIVVTIQ